MSDLLEAIVIETALYAMDRGLTPEHLTEGWAFYPADAEFIEQELGRKLLPREWEQARKVFAEAVKEISNDRMS